MKVTLDKFFLIQNKDNRQYLQRVDHLDDNIKATTHTTLYLQAMRFVKRKDANKYVTDNTLDRSSIIKITITGIY